jgi:gamma-glutamylcyclotransferase (GGCT)/AIG2-like uncharacterized protein YtfP
MATYAYMHNLFAYGSLLRPDIQETLFGKRLFGTMDTLVEYEKGIVEIDGKTFNTAWPKEGSLIDGIVFELTDEELVRTDAYEGEPYTRTKVELMSGREAWVYVRHGIL